MGNDLKDFLRFVVEQSNTKNIYLNYSNGVIFIAGKGIVLVDSERKQTIVVNITDKKYLIGKGVIEGLGILNPTKKPEEVPMNASFDTQKMIDYLKNEKFEETNILSEVGIKGIV